MGPTRQPDATLELLVHGVGGHTPGEMLDSARTVRVSGDATAALHRRVDDTDAERRTDPADRPEGPIQEAYCWSGLTSGGGTRALWLLLLPFMVVNIAHWMRPDTHGITRVRRLYGVLVRLLALTLTVLFTASACEVALDLTAWQCAGSALCGAQRSWLAFLSPAHHGWWSQPGRRLALAAVVPTALVGLLWYLSHRTWAMYETQRPPGADEDADPDTDPASPRPALARPGFWYGRRIVARLRAAHTAAGFVTVAAALAGAAVRHDAATGGAELLGRLLQAALACCALTVVWVVCRSGRSESVRDLRLDSKLTAALPGAALALLVLSGAYAGWSRTGWHSSGTLTGDGTFRVVALAQAVLVVALACCALVLHRTTRRPGTALRGLGGPAVAMFACAIAGVMTGGVAQRVADWLDGDATPGMGAAAAPAPPPLLSWQASVIPVLLVLLLVPVGVLAVRTARAARAERPRVEADFGVGGGPGQERADAARTGQIADRRALVRLTDQAPRLVGVLAGAALLLGAAAVALSWISGEVPGRAAEHTGPFLQGVAETAQGLGSWFVGIGFLAFVTLGRLAYSRPAIRQTVGILWDVGTFWPRAAHPFAPPCYAERAVPDLIWRISTWTRATGGRLVLSGHSQGTVLAAATVWQLDAATRKRTALLTYGAPLKRLYGRWFPAYFGEPQLTALHREMPSWRNLWRDTDAIGGPVGATDGGALPDVDRGPLRDPLSYGRRTDRPLPEGINGHGDYQADPAFAEERATLLRAPLPAVPGQPRRPDGVAHEEATGGTAKDSGNGGA
ncbi:hypothetical protein [Streptomyces sp. 8L]|uniref:hypothetical protein n=1 Tax=Streptomyces sp. 8L TaxID=2877242 RepID=UPI001CD46808|nr:hypothetical protein [Streptomyces sp. 8L]MCA1223210.1 hypothetical protein [Streptomyces sp. 8L]